MAPISNLAVEDQPREKLVAKGAQALSDLELMAVLLGSGSRKCGVMTLAARILKVLDRSGAGDLKVSDLTALTGVGPAKAGKVVAALELARRRIHPEGLKIGQPTDVLPLIRHLSDRKQEYFMCISLNGANEVIASRTVSIGLVNQTQVHPREVFADPLTDRAAAVIVAHNHPSGSLAPSPQDLTITQRLKDAGDTLGIPVLDHIIFNHKGYYSFMEDKRLKPPPSSP